MHTIQGITALPTDSNNLFQWSAKVEGLGGTVWEGINIGNLIT